MFEKTDKRRLYWLMEMFLSGEIDAWTFCDEYYYCYGQELDRNNLSNKEQKMFGELLTVSGRYSKFEEDFKNYPGVYVTEQQLKKTVIEAKEVLKSESSI